MAMPKTNAAIMVNNSRNESRNVFIESISFDAADDLPDASPADRETPHRHGQSALESSPLIGLSTLQLPYSVPKAGGIANTDAGK